jgi:hypothetical protein
MTCPGGGGRPSHWYAGYSSTESGNSRGCPLTLLGPVYGQIAARLLPELGIARPLMRPVLLSMETMQEFTAGSVKLGPPWRQHNVTLPMLRHLCPQRGIAGGAGGHAQVADLDRGRARSAGHSIVAISGNNALVPLQLVRGPAPKSFPRLGRRAGQPTMVPERRKVGQKQNLCCSRRTNLAR